MTLAIALLVGIGGLIGGVGILVPRWMGPRCPVCARRTARLISRKRGHERDEDRTVYFEARYECRRCRTELVQRDGGPLITKGAWDAGMRHALPPATVIDRRIP